MIMMQSGNDTNETFVIIISYYQMYSIKILSSVVFLRKKHFVSVIQTIPKKYDRLSKEFF